MVKIYNTDEESRAAGIDVDAVNKTVSALFETGEAVSGNNYTIMLNAFLKAAAYIVGLNFNEEGEKAAFEVFKRIIDRVREENRKTAN